MGVKRKQPTSSSVVELNVGGEVFVTTRETLSRMGPDSYFAKLLEKPPTLDREGRIFIDRDPANFRTVLNLLRGSAGGLDEDKRFYGVDSLPAPSTSESPRKKAKLDTSDDMSSPNRSNDSEPAFSSLAKAFVRCLDELSDDVKDVGILMALGRRFANEVGPQIIRASLRTKAEAVKVGCFVGSLLALADTFRKDEHRLMQISGDLGPSSLLTLLRVTHVNCTAGIAKSFKNGEASLALLDGLLSAAKEFPVVHSHGKLLIKQLKKAVVKKTIPTKLTEQMIAALEEKNYISEEQFSGVTDEKTEGMSSS